MFFGSVYKVCNATEPGPVEISYITVSLSSLLLLITVPTNLLVCLAILIDPNKELRTQFNCLTFNLALADLLVGCFTEFLSVYYHIKEGMDVQKGNNVEREFQKLLHVQLFISSAASVLSIAALALERYLAIVCPFTYRRYFSVKLAVVISVIIWILSIGYGLSSLVIEYIRGSFIFGTFTLVFIGGVVTFVSYKIIAALRNSSHEWPEVRGDHIINAQRKQRKLTKTFGLIIGALMLCYIPACAVIYYINFCQNCNCDLVQWFRDLAIWLIFLNSAFNPFIYGFRVRSFRKAIRKILRCACCCNGEGNRAENALEMNI